MGALWFYLLALVLLCVIGFYRRWNAFGKMLLILYTFIALVAMWVPDRGTLLYVNKLDESLITFPIVAFMILAYIIFFSPFLRKNDNFNARNLEFSVTGNYTFFAKVFTLCALITVLLYSRQVIGLLQGGNWAANRLVMAADDAIYPYSNIVEKLIILFTSYFQLLALLVGFMMLKEGTYKKLGIMTIASASAFEFCTDIYTSSRGMLAVYILILLALFMFFYTDIDVSSRRFINVMCIAVAFIVGPYFVAVTISRFSEQAINSLVYYFGQPPYAFALEVNSVTEFMHGQFAFGPLFGEAKFAENLGSWVRAFYTFLGWLYVDWGFWGTVIIGIFCAWIFGRIIRKRRLRMCDAYILFFYYKMLVLGVFTIGRTRCYEIIISLFIYLFLKFVLDRYQFYIGARRLR